MFSMLTFMPYRCRFEYMASGSSPLPPPPVGPMFVMMMFMILMTVLIMTPSIRTSLGTQRSTPFPGLAGGVFSSSP